MTRPLKAGFGPAVALLCTVGFSAPALADPQLGGRIASLIGQERIEIGALRATRVRELVMPNAIAAQVVYDHSYLDALPVAGGTAEWQCLATALYFEARGESVEGQFAVAEVILNRVDSPRYPDTICNVVYQGARTGGGCQFSFACDGKSEDINEARTFERIAKIAQLMKEGAPRQLTGGATHFHTRAVSPRWSLKFPRTAEIGAHLFYRQPGVLVAQN
jgi:spore germination cell wall hydrolase CwlJ-like protein